MLRIGIVLLVLMFDLDIINAAEINRDQQSGKADFKRYLSTEKLKVTPKSIEIQSLLPASSVPIPFGIYKSDDMDLILSVPINQFGSLDYVIFDVDEVLMTGYVPFFAEIAKKFKNFYHELFFKHKSTAEKLVLFMFSHVPWVFMDDRLPSLIERLRSKAVNILANTAIDPLINSQIGLDLPRSRVQTLRDFNLDFSKTCPTLDTWDFDTLTAEEIKKDNPIFKEGIIFSAQTPKHITTHKLFERLGITPRIMLYIDDSAENAKAMFEFITSKGIGCYAIVYTKKESKPLKDFFEVELFNQKLREIESFLEALLLEKNIDKLLQRAESSL